MNELDFDDLIKDKLQNLSSAVPKGMWDKIAVQSQATILNDEQFDETIKNKLGNYSSAVTTGLWNKIITGYEIDTNVKQKLENYPSQVPAEMWGKIEEDEERRRTIFWWWNNKAGWLTAAAIILLLIGGYSVLNNKKNTNNNNASSDILLQENKKDVASPSDNTTNKTQSTNAANDNVVNNLSDNNNTSSTLNISGSHNSFSDNNKKQKAISNTRTDDFVTGNDGIVLSSQNGSINANGNSSIADELFTLTPKNYAASDLEMQAASLLSIITPYTPNIDINSYKLASDCPSAKEPLRNDWYLEVYGSPDYNMKSVNANGLSDAYIQAKNNSEKMGIGFTAGARLSHNIGDHIIIKAGLQYSQANEKFTKRTENFRQTTTIIDTLRDAQGNIVSVNTRTLTQIGYKEQSSINRYSNIEVPLSVGYEFGKKDDTWKFGINAGAIVNLTSWYSGETLDTSYNVVSFNSKNNSGIYRQNVGVSLFGNISAIYKLNNAFDVFAEPYFRYSLSNISSSAGYTQRFNAFGLTFGVRMKLNNKRQHL